MISFYMKLETNFESINHAVRGYCKYTLYFTSIAFLFYMLRFSRFKVQFVCQILCFIYDPTYFALPFVLSYFKMNAGQKISFLFTV